MPTPQRQGLPLYPGARLKHEKDNDPLNFGILTESLGMQLMVVKYESDDSPAKIVDYYRAKLKKFGKVLECHSQKHGGGVDVHDSDTDSKDSKELKCEENSGPVTELKVGTEDNQHVVASSPAIPAKDRLSPSSMCTLAASAETSKKSVLLRLLRRRHDGPRTKCLQTKSFVILRALRGSAFRVFCPAAPMGYFLRYF